MSIDGQVLRAADAKLTTNGGSALWVVVSTGPIECRDLRGPLPAPRSGGEFFRLLVAPRIAPGGEQSWRILSGYFDGATKHGDLGPADVEAPRSNAGETTELGLDVVLEGAGERSRLLEGHGRVAAVSCGTYRVDDAVPRPHDVDLVISGHSMSVAGATLDRTDLGFEIRLSTGPADCGTTIIEGDAVLRLSFRGTKRPELRSANLRGDLFAGEVSDLVPGGLAVSLDGSPRGRGTVGVELDGSFVIGGHAVRLSGRVEAERCN